MAMYRGNLAVTFFKYYHTAVGGNIDAFPNRITKKWHQLSGFVLNRYLSLWQTLDVTIAFVLNIILYVLGIIIMKYLKINKYMK